MELDRALVYVEADVLLTSMGGSSSRFLARRTAVVPGVVVADVLTGGLGDNDLSAAAAAGSAASA